MSLNAPPAAKKYVLPMSAFPARPALARRLAPAAVHVHPAARVKSAKGRVPDAHNAGDGYGPAVCCRKASLRSPRVSCWTDSTVLCPCRESTMSLCQSLTGHCMLCQSLTGHCMLCSCCCCKVSLPPPTPLPCSKVNLQLNIPCETFLLTSSLRVCHLRHHLRPSFVPLLFLPPPPFPHPSVFSPSSLLLHPSSVIVVSSLVSLSSRVLSVPCFTVLFTS